MSFHAVRINYIREEIPPVKDRSGSKEKYLSKDKNFSKYPLSLKRHLRFFYAYPQKYQSCW